ncbi:hypothetical protein [Tsukamurella soli]|uniref:Uncharacterized protein n=1 Tax=Tsukamurella soli TaxID=644556 RepID=A0ABP8J693_9ACTN
MLDHYDVRGRRIEFGIRPAVPQPPRRRILDVLTSLLNAAADLDSMVWAAKYQAAHAELEH